MKALKMLVAASVAFASVTAHAATGDVAVGSGSVTAGSVTTSGPAVTSGTSVSLNVEGAPSLVSVTPTSATLQWNKVAAAVSYVVKYSKNSVATSADPNAVYDNETAPVADTGTTIGNLTEGATYYFAVVALDKDGNESDSLSEELVVNLSATAPATASGVTSGLALASVTAKNVRTLTLEFSAPLGSDPVSVKLQKTANSASIPVTNVVVDPANPTTATATLGADLEGDSTYSLTVISAKDQSGNNIPEGINAIKEFTTVASLAPATEVPLNAGGPEALSAAASGTPVAAAATALPTTGAKENLILILALLSGLGIVFAFRKKAA